LFEFRPRQDPGEVVLVSGWLADEEFPIFPQGSREKKALFSPEGTLGFIVDRHRYLFKYSVRRHPVQFWSEIIAYEIGRVMDVAVPPALVSIDADGQAGALIEFFYGHPSDQEALRYVAGADYFVRIIPGFDTKTGRQHSVRGIVRICRSFERLGMLKGWVDYWAKVFAFDAVIGNTDRHQENWGLLWNEDATEASFAPAFDNGTSLGYEQLDERLGKFSDRNCLDAYIARGQHHPRWNSADENRLGHAELCVRFASEFPGARDSMLEAVNFNPNEIDDLLNWCTQFDVPVNLSPARSEFLASLIKARRTALADALEQVVEPDRAHR
jgi:hypothetical protein